MSGKRFLIVQCCHLPHFFFIAGRLREEHPDASFDALMIDRPQARTYVSLFPLFESVHFSPDAEKLTEYDGVILPLLNRGYRHIKKSATSGTLGPLYEVGFSGELRPLSRLRLLLSFVHVSEKPTEDFAAYLENFPHRPRPERVLLIQSCHESLLPKATRELSQVIEEGAEIIPVRKAPLRTLLRKFRGQELDTACIFLTGERGFLGLKLLPFILRIRRIVIINENLNFFEASFSDLARFMYQRIRYGTKLPSPLPPRIVLFQTETASYLRQAARRLKQRQLFPNSEIIIVCRPEDQAEVESIPDANRVICYPPRGLRNYYRLWRNLDRLQPDLACGIFSGRSVHRWEKLLFFCLPAPGHLAFNATLDCYQVSLTRVFWMFRSEPLVFDEQLLALSNLNNYVLILQTADDRKMLKALAKLRDPRITRPAPIAVFCSEDKRTLFHALPGVKAVYTYRPGKRWEGIRAFLRLRTLSVDVMATVLTGDKYPRLHKLLFLALPARNRLVFNPDFNCFYLNRLNPFSVVPLFRGVVRRGNLLIQTADDQATLRALAKLRDPQIARPAPITVFCAEDKKEVYQGVSGVKAVYTYRPNQRWSLLRAAFHLRRLHFDVLAAVLTGDRSNRLHRLLFLVLPARNRLVFNSDFNCFYLNRLNLFSLVSFYRGGSRRGSLLIQTADDETTLRALEKLRDPSITRPAPIAVFCCETKKQVFTEVPGVTAVYTYPAKRRGAMLRAAFRLRKLNFDVLAGILTGTPSHRLLKFLFLILPAPNRLVLNQDANCFYLRRLNPLSLLRLLRVGSKRCILLIQTADDASVFRALDKIRDPRVTTPAPIVVFCRSDKRELFARIPEVYAVYTYEPNRRWRALRTLLELFRLDVEVATALFTGESIFRLQKLLFFLLPARNRLVFNHNLDCYYLNRSTFWSLFRSEERLGQLSSSLLFTRLLGKALLFFPRFLYLVIWVTGQKLRRAYSLSSEVR